MDLFARGSEDGIFESWGQASVDFVIPAAANGPARFSVGGHYFSGYLVSGADFPAAGFEV